MELQLLADQCSNLTITVSNLLANTDVKCFYTEGLILEDSDYERSIPAEWSAEEQLILGVPFSKGPVRACFKLFRTGSPVPANARVIEVLAECGALLETVPLDLLSEHIPEERFLIPELWPVGEPRLLRLGAMESAHSSKRELEAAWISFLVDLGWHSPRFPQGGDRWWFALPDVSRKSERLLEFGTMKGNSKGDLYYQVERTLFDSTNGVIRLWERRDGEIVSRVPDVPGRYWMTVIDRTLGATLAALNWLKNLIETGCHEWSSPPMSIAEFANKCDRGESTIRNWCDSGKVKRKGSRGAAVFALDMIYQIDPEAVANFRKKS